jgi:L-threonylcarbamoyladenylate synthase
VELVAAGAGNDLSAVVDKAVNRLDGGGVIAVPSDGGYSLVADVSYAGSADRLFSLTKRPRTFELSMFVADAEQALTTAMGVGSAAEKIMDKFWPGPVTLVLPRDPDFVADLGSDEETIGLHCPDQVLVRLICEESGPLAAVGACQHGSAPATTASQVAEIFGENVSIVCDGGELAVARTTVVDCTGEPIKCIREGAISWADISSILD